MPVDDLSKVLIYGKSFILKLLALQSHKQKSQKPKRFWMRRFSLERQQKGEFLLATEIFKTKNELNPKIMEEIFTFKNVDYDLRNNTSLKIGNLKTVYYGTESLTNLSAKNLEHPAK